jgi:hypothetical protein
MKRLRLALAVAGGLAGVALLGFFLANANKVFPESGAKSPGHPITIYVRPQTVSAEIPAVAQACSNITTDLVGGITAGPTEVRVQIKTASADKVHVKGVVITVEDRRSVPAADYTRCAKALPATPSTSRAVPGVALPSAGSVPVPPDVVRTTAFPLNVLPPARQPTTPTVYTWYVAVSASSDEGEISDQSIVFVTLVPPSRHHG